MKQIEWTITRNQEAASPDLPSHLFPGCGNGVADFLITSSSKVECPEEMKQLLQEYSEVAYLMHFDTVSQRGRFGLVDEDAPSAGTVLNGQVWEEEDYRSQEEEWYRESLEREEEE